jgi:hypothetical protein
MNFYLLSTTDDSPEEITADGYERDGDDWIFTLAGVEIVRNANEFCRQYREKPSLKKHSNSRSLDSTSTSKRARDAARGCILGSQAATVERIGMSCVVSSVGNRKGSCTSIRLRPSCLAR